MNELSTNDDSFTGDEVITVSLVFELARFTAQ